MKAKALELTFPIPGLGRLSETEFEFDSLEQAFGLGWPVTSGDWQRKLRRLRQRPVRGKKPKDFNGWIFRSQRIPPYEFLVYEYSLDPLAAALNSGELTPCGPPDLLARWGLTARGRASRTGLTKNVSLLRSMRVIPSAFLDKAGLIEAGKKAEEFDCDWFEEPAQLRSRGSLSDPRNNNTVKLMEKVGHHGWNGLLRAVAAPIVARIGDESVARARWVAQFPRPLESSERWPLPYVVFDGRKFEYKASLDDLPGEMRLDLQRSGEFLVAQSNKLLPPFSLRARYVFNVRQATQQDDSQEGGAPFTSHLPKLPRGLVAVPAMAAVPLSAEGVTRLSDEQARIAWELHSGKVELADDAPPRESWDIFLCHRQSPLAGEMPADQVVRQMSLQREKL